MQTAYDQLSKVADMKATLCATQQARLCIRNDSEKTEQNNVQEALPPTMAKTTRAARFRIHLTQEFVQVEANQSLLCNALAVLTTVTSAEPTRYQEAS